MISSDDLARESLLILFHNGNVLTKLLGTPGDERELFFGHLVSEGYLEHSKLDIESEFEFRINEFGAHEIHLVGPELKEKSSSPERIIKSSCGACDADGLEELIHDLPILDIDSREIDFSNLNKSFDDMKIKQKGFSSTGGMHAAGIIDIDYNLLSVKEDIGRHNAVDKVIGDCIIKKINFADSILLLSGRCGWDIVAKACRSNIRTIVSIGACSSLAASTARKSGMRIYSFVKPDNAVIIGN